MYAIWLLLEFLTLLFVTTASAYAQSSVTLYGTIDQGINYVNNAQSIGPSGKRTGSSQWSNTSSIAAGNKFGMRGVEDLGNGYEALFQLESGFDTSTGKLAQGGTFFGRQAIVGLLSRYGTVTLGRQYDFIVDFVQPVSAIVFGIGPTLSTHGDEIDNLADTYRVNNSIKYTSASYGGFTFGGMYSFGGVAGAMSRNAVYSFGASYERGPIKVAAAFLRANEPNLSYWGNNQNSSPTANNLGATSGVQVNPVYGGFASARTLDIFATGFAYTIGQLVAGFDYSNIRFEHLNDGNAGMLSLTNPFGYQGTAIFNDYTIYGRYFVTPSFSIVGAYNLLVGGAVDGKPAARYNQFNAAFNYFLSKRTEVYILAEYQIASGTDSTKQAAVPLSEGYTPSNTGRQVILRAGIRHVF